MHKAKKSLGQNFLKSNTILNKIIESGKIDPTDIVLEIGPGRGALTKQLLASSCQLIAVEKDRELFEFLKTKFEKEISSGQLTLINEDILKFSVEQSVLERTLGRSGGDGQRKFSAGNFRGKSENVLRKYKIIANIPYNITGAILKKFLSTPNQPSTMVLMVQHEVAKRIMAHDKKESILSISVKIYGEPKMIMKVGAQYFSPKPKVDSAIIQINNISRNTFEKNKLDEEKFWQIIHAGFAHKRKKLSGNLKAFLKNKKEMLLLYGDKRAEDLSLLDWIKIADDN